MMDFTEKLDASFGIKLIVTGLARLVEQEGYTPHEAFQELEEIKSNTFHALADLRKEGESHDN